MKSKTKVSSLSNSKTDGRKTKNLETPNQPNVKKENDINDETKVDYSAFEGLNFVKCGSKEEFIDSLENVAEKDLLEISIKYVCEMC